MRKTLLLLLFLAAPPLAADDFLGLGGGVGFTDGAAAQAALGVWREAEIHAAWWGGDSANRALGAGWRFRLSGHLAAVAGGAYVGHKSANLPHRANVYFEARWELARHFACQLGHYSGRGHDNGENLLLCGVFRRR